MKIYLLTGLALLAAVAARAEVYRSRVRDYGYRGRTVVEVGLPLYGSGYCSTLSNYGTYGAYPTYGSYTAGGLWWGALTGAIVGHNSGSLHHSAGRGAAIGAGVGMLLGAIADANRPVVAPQPTAVYLAAPAATATTYAAPAPVLLPAPTPVETTPMSTANGLFGR